LGAAQATRPAVEVADLGHGEDGCASSSSWPFSPNATYFPGERLAHQHVDGSEVQLHGHRLVERDPHWPLELHDRSAAHAERSAGVSAGIDMALTLLARIHGPQLAQMIQLAIEYDPRPPFRR